MSEVDRLRQAADRLDRDADFDAANGHAESAAFCRAAAALLRAVADAIWFTVTATSSGRTPPEFGWDAAVAVAASALANTILWTDNE